MYEIISRVFNGSENWVYLKSGIRNVPAEFFKPNIPPEHTKKRKVFSNFLKSRFIINSFKF